MPKIPRSKDTQAAAEYWDKEDVTNHPDELKEVVVQVSKNLAHVLSVRVDRQDLQQLQTLADEQGVGVTTMARMLLKKGLSQQNEDDDEDVRLEMAQLALLSGEEPSLNKEVLHESLQLLQQLFDQNRQLLEQNMQLSEQNKRLHEQRERPISSR